MGEDVIGMDAAAKDLAQNEIPFRMRCRPLGRSE